MKIFKSAIFENNVLVLFDNGKSIKISIDEFPDAIFLTPGKILNLEFENETLKNISF